MRPGKWTLLMDDTDYLECRSVAHRVFQFLQITDMDDACGRDNEGRAKFCAELSLVDLNAITPASLKSAIKSCGWDDMPTDDVAIAQCLFQYGTRAPLWDDVGNGRVVMQRAARREARSLLDASTLESAMSRPVNALGSTAAEYMRGDLDSALARGVHSGNPSARVMAKMYGIPQEAIDDSRPADWLPYFMGYMSAMQGGEKLSDPDTVPEYFQGYDRGTNVRAGSCPAPGWIK